MLSSITAIAVACGATFIIVWRKIKKGAQKVLHIDNNTNKEVEDELVITDETEKVEGEPVVTDETEKVEDEPVVTDETEKVEE